MGGPGWTSRVRSFSGATFLAGLIGYPVGHLQLRLDQMIRPEQKQSNHVTTQPKDETDSESERNKSETIRTPYPMRDYDVVGAVIGKLDQSLHDAQALNERRKSPEHMDEKRRTQTP